MAAEWHFRIMGTEFGPVSPSELVEQAADGKIGPDTEVRRGDGAWVPASRVAGLFDKASQVKGTAAKTAVPPPLPSESASVFIPVPFPSYASLSKTEVIDTAEDDRFRVEILAYSSLGGAKDHQTAATIYFANQAGIRLKQVRITLRDGEAIAESGALHFMLGQIHMESKIGGVSGLGRAMMNKFVTKEAAIMPRYLGTGQIYQRLQTGGLVSMRAASRTSNTAT
jgi:GYF domain 2